MGCHFLLRGLFPPIPGALSGPGIETESPACPALADGFFTTAELGNKFKFILRFDNLSKVISLLLLIFSVPLYPPIEPYPTAIPKAWSFYRK